MEVTDYQMQCGKHSMYRFHTAQVLQTSKVEKKLDKFGFSIFRKPVQFHVHTASKNIENMQRYEYHICILNITQTVKF